MRYVRSGDAFAATVVVYDEDGAAVDLTNAALSASLLDARGGVAVTLTAAMGSETGEIAVSADTSTWPSGVPLRLVVAHDDVPTFPGIMITAVDAAAMTTITITSPSWSERGGDSAGKAATLARDMPSGGSSGLLFEAVTTSTASVAPTTEAQGESAAGGAPPAGTLTPTGGVAATWMPSIELLEFSTDGAFEGVQLRRILTGTLPEDGYVVDVGIGYLATDPNAYGVIMFGYEQNAGTAFTGLGLYMRDGATNCDLMAVGDDGSGAPYTPTAVVATMGFNNTLNDWTYGPVRVVLEFRKLDGVSPTQWAVRILTISRSGGAYMTCLSQVAYPEASFGTPIVLNGWAPDRIGVGFWNTAGAQVCTMRLSHLRVYSLGSAVPA